MEKVYKNAMKAELNHRGVAVELEAKINVSYKGQLVGEYYADLFVADRVLVELKVAKKYNSADESQLLNELKAASIKVGLLINFGRDKVEFKRLVY